jgi:4-aminobutyrate aminotransferase-like enzyme
VTEPAATADVLDTPPPTFSVEEAADLAARVFGIDGTPSLLVSERDQNFRVAVDGGRGYVLKISNPAEDPAVVDMETQVLLHVARVDPSLPLPRPHPAVDGDFHPWIEGADGRRFQVRLIDFMPGRMLAADAFDEAMLFGYGACVARVGRAMRGFFHPAAHRVILWDVRHAPKLRGLLPEIEHPDAVELVTRALDRFDERVAPLFDRLRAQVIHDDMTIDNVLFDEDGAPSGIVDFGDMSHTALICDLTSAFDTLLVKRDDPYDTTDAMIRGYASVTPLEEEELAVLPDVLAARSAAAVTITAWRLKRYPENADYISGWEAGARRVLELLDGDGRAEAERRFRASARLGWVATLRDPALTAHEDDERLLRRRRDVMGTLSPLFFEKPVHLVRGEGAYLFDPDGRAYLDAYNNVPVVGHCHPRVVEAIARQAATLATNSRYLHEHIVELAERLTASMPGGLDTVVFVNSGSEANDLAWRLATEVTGGSGGVATAFAYHGVTTATQAFTPEEWIEGDEPDHVLTVPAPDGYRGSYRREEPGWAERYAEHLDRAFAGLRERGFPPAMVLMDTGFMSDGIPAPPPAYLQEVVRRTREAGALFVADEVQAGYGRLGTPWGFQVAGIEPDVVTLGKPMGNGFPVAAVVTRRGIVDRFERRREFFSTFAGNPVAGAAALAVLDVLEEERLADRAVAVGDLLRRRIRELAERHEAIGDVRGLGQLTGVELVRDRESREPAGREAALVAEGMRDRGVLIGTTGPDANVLKIRPPLVFSGEDAERLVTALDDALGSLPT